MSTETNPTPEGKEKNRSVIVELCSGSGNWSKPYEDAGYAVIRIDIRNGDDVRLQGKPGFKVHGVIAGPPCDDLAGSGARWWKEKGIKSLFNALSIVDACCRFILINKPEWWCLENPVGRLSKYLGKPVMTFQPYEYGDPYQKRTCLWGDFNIPKKNPVEPTEGQKIWRMAPGPDRKRLRSITPSGFAWAFMEANP